MTICLDAEAQRPQRTRREIQNTKLTKITKATTKSEMLCGLGVETAKISLNIGRTSAATPS